MKWEWHRDAARINFTKTTYFNAMRLSRGGHIFIGEGMLKLIMCSSSFSLTSAVGHEHVKNRFIKSNVMSASTSSLVRRYVSR